MDLMQLSFWEDEAGRLWDFTAAEVFLILRTALDNGIELLPETVRALIAWDLASVVIARYSAKYRFLWIKRITETTRIQVQEIFSQWLLSGDRLFVLKTALESIFGPVRASMIAATEITRLYAIGNMMAWELSEVVESYRWMTARDDKVCALCSELDGRVTGLGDIDAAPPAHVNCRCWIQPIVSEGALRRSIDKILETVPG